MGSTSSTHTTGGDKGELLDDLLAERVLFRKGLYKYKQLPAVLGVETAGVVVGLPRDEAVLNNETYRSKNLVIGSKVACVGALNRRRILRQLIMH